MTLSIESFDISNLRRASTSFSIELPRQCPHCNKGLEPKFLSAYHLDGTHKSVLFVLFFCPVCDSCFIGVYGIAHHGYGSSSTYLIHLFPYGDEKTIFSDKLVELSPSFVKIYHQAEKAEQLGLDEICGIGYRKALEFLVKDYAILMNPESEDKIKKQNLSPCISEHIDNPRIKALATASAWIGNDETHYVRKHQDYDLSHLKAFVSAMVSYVDSELHYLEAYAFLNQPK